jgi:ECF sigma factor
MRKGRQDTELGIGNASDDLLIVSKTVFLELSLCNVGQLPADGQEVKTFAPGVTGALPQPKISSVGRRAVWGIKIARWYGWDAEKRRRSIVALPDEVGSMQHPAAGGTQRTAVQLRAAPSLKAWREGDEMALERLVPLVDAEMRRLARQYLRQERPGHILQTTALVNEAWVRLINWPDVSWQNRAHFIGLAARLMRRVLVDEARRRRAMSARAFLRKLAATMPICAAKSNRCLSRTMPPVASDRSRPAGVPIRAGGGMDGSCSTMRASTSFQSARAIQRPPGFCAAVFAIFENVRAVDEDVFYSD